MGNKPVDTIRDGAIKVSIWKNDKKDADGSFFTSTLSRTFTDEVGNLQDTYSMTGKLDVLRAQRLLGKVVDRIETLENDMKS